MRPCRNMTLRPTFPHSALRERGPIGRIGSQVLLMLLMFLSACSPRPYVKENLDLEQAPREFAAARLEDDALGEALKRLDPTAEWPPRTLSPPRLGLLAALRSRDVREARASILAAEAAREVAVQRQNPLVSLGFERHSLVDDNQSGNWSIGPSVEFTLAPRGRRALVAARAEVEVRQARLASLSAAWAARDAATTAALELLAQRELTARETAVKAASDEALGAARASVAAGIADPFEWQTLMLAANEARLVRLTRMTQTTQAEAALAGTLGLPVSACAELSLAATARGKVPSFRELQQHMLTHDPRVLGALAAFDAADRDLALAVHAQYPSVQLNPGYFFDQGDHVWSLLGGVVVPVLASQDAAIDSAEARRATAREHVHAAQTGAIAALSEAHARWRTSLEVRREARLIAADMKKHHAALVAKAAQGIVDQLSVRRAAQQVEEMSVQLAMSDAAVSAARHALESAARMPFDDPVFTRFLDELQATAAAQPES
ncbi:MAG: hypothetical protein RL434_1077 [Pseudomonadota bacterium]